MGHKSKQDYFRAIYERYHESSSAEKSAILTEFCRVCGYNRKYAIRKLSRPPTDPGKSTPRKRAIHYSYRALSVIHDVWRACGYPCGVRLKAVLKGWLPRIRSQFTLSKDLEKEILSISARQIDRRLRKKKCVLKGRLYGRTRPGSLLKHSIPVKTDNWDVKIPGYSEIDTVSHCGGNGEGHFAYTVNDTDVHSAWTESRAVLGKGEVGVVSALDDIGSALPYKRLGLDSDNGSEFVNWHLVRYCKTNGIQPFRGRPYKKDDNAYVEQKNFTHVRKLLGWDRYDTQEAVDAINDLYRHEWSWFMNLFMPSMKLKAKERKGSRVIRRYDTPQTPLERVQASDKKNPKKTAPYEKLKNSLNPFELEKIISRKIRNIQKLASRSFPSRPADLKTK